MGALTLPTSGLICIDTMALIFSVERFPAYWPMLELLWLSARAGNVDVACSELTLLEALVGPFKSGITALERIYEHSLQAKELRLLPITHAVLRAAARLRATTRLKTPDAIHAATALEASCVLFVTNDAAFRGVSGLPFVILDDLLIP